MFPPTATPPLPPQIQQQQMQPQGPQDMAAMFGRMSSAMPDPVTILEMQLAKLEAWAAETAPLTNQLNPALTTLLVPIAQAGKALQAEIAKLKQQTAGPSPMVTGSVPPNLPGNIPGNAAPM